MKADKKNTLAMMAYLSEHFPPLPKKTSIEKDMAGREIGQLPLDIMDAVRIWYSLRMKNEEKLSDWKKFLKWKTEIRDSSGLNDTILGYVAVTVAWGFDDLFFKKEKVKGKDDKKSDKNDEANQMRLGMRDLATYVAQQINQRIPIYIMRGRSDNEGVSDREQQNMEKKRDALLYNLNTLCALEVGYFLYKRWTETYMEFTYQDFQSSDKKANALRDRNHNRQSMEDRLKKELTLEVSRSLVKAYRGHFEKHEAVGNNKKIRPEPIGFMPLSMDDWRIIFERALAEIESTPEKVDT